MMKRLTIIVTLWFLAMSAFAETTKVAILEIVDKVGDIKYSTKLMVRANLISAITSTSGYEGFDRVDVDQLMKEHNFQRTGLVNEETIKQLGELTGAQLILVAEAVKADEENIFVTATLIDVETGQYIKSNNTLMGIAAADMQRGCRKLASILFDVAVVDDELPVAGQAPAASNSASAPGKQAQKDNSPQWVDLGLPSGVLWATCNLGAASPEEAGEYYAWGEIAEKFEYNSDSCKYPNGTTRVISGTEDADAATAILGSPWRIPTVEEMEELLENCRTNQINYKGVEGFELKSMKNGRTIFLPAAGFKNGSMVNGASRGGYYWTGSPYYGYSKGAYALIFNALSSIISVDSTSLYLGQSIRPVKK